MDGGVHLPEEDDETDGYIGQSDGEATNIGYLTSLKQNQCCLVEAFVFDLVWIWFGMAHHIASKLPVSSARLIWPYQSVY